jgi:aminopeptidase N
MCAKTFYTTTIVADKKYTNIITNGALIPLLFWSLGSLC